MPSPTGETVPLPFRFRILAIGPQLNAVIRRKSATSSSCGVIMAIPGTTARPRAVAASNSLVRGGATTTSTTNAAGGIREMSTGIGSSALTPSDVALITMSKSAGSRYTHAPRDRIRRAFAGSWR